jgi:transposase
MSRQLWNYLVRDAVDVARTESRVARKHYARWHARHPDVEKMPKKVKSSISERAKKVCIRVHGHDWREPLRNLPPMGEITSALRAQRPWWGLPGNMSNAVLQTAQDAVKKSRPPRMKRRGRFGELTLPGPTNGAKDLVLDERDPRTAWLTVPNAHLKLKKGKRVEDQAVTGNVRAKRHRPRVEDQAVAGNVRVLLHRPLPPDIIHDEGKPAVRRVALVHEAGAWYVSVTYEYVAPGRDVAPDRALICGVDRNMATNLCTFSCPVGPVVYQDGTQPESLSAPWTDPYMVPYLVYTAEERKAAARRDAHARRIARLVARTHLDKAARASAINTHKWGRRSRGEDDPGQPKSKRWAASDKAATKAADRGARNRKEVRRLVADRLTYHCRIVVFEALDARQMMARTPGAGAGGRGRNRKQATQGWGDLRLQTESSAQLRDTLVIEVPSAYTSQTCAECGHPDSASRQDQATYVCTACGHTDNADRNAARNIEHRGAALLSAPIELVRAAQSPKKTKTGAAKDLQTLLYACERLSAAEKADLARAPKWAQSWALSYLKRVAADHKARSN